MSDSAPLFIVGCGRSGSTMLRLMLDSHPELAIPGESHLIPAIWRRRASYHSNGVLDVSRLTADILRSPHIGEWNVSEEAVRRRVASLDPPTIAGVIEAVYLASAEQRGKGRWGDKTPSYVMAIPLVATLFPAARFIHLIRDGRDVALSYLARPMFPRTIWEAAWRWNQMVTAGLKTGRPLGSQRYLEVRYEDLVDDARAVLHRICAFADLSFDGSMLDYHRDVRQPFAGAAGVPPVPAGRRATADARLARLAHPDGSCGPVEIRSGERRPPGISRL